MARDRGNPYRSAAGKLRAVARAWLAGADDGDDDEFAADLAALGETWQRPSHQPVPIWPENVASTNVFFALETQWKTTPTGALLALDYGVIPGVLEMLGEPRELWRKRFSDLRVMEREVLTASLEDAP